MKKSLRWAMLLSVLLALMATPVLAAEPGGGDIHFGNFTLAAGDSVSGDQLVFGNATLERASTLNGELVVFGTLTMEEEAVVNGTVMVAGTADIAGRVNGDVDSTGPVTLRSTAVIAGDVSTTGALSREEGAVVEGTIKESGPSGFDWDWRWSPGWPRSDKAAQPLWMVWLWKLVRAVLALLVFSLLALLVSAVWPEQLGRVAETIAEQPLMSFGMGVLVLLTTLGVSTMLLITLCLSPFALLGFLALALALGIGWIALGYVLGMRFLNALSASMPNKLGATVLGTFFLTLMAVLLNWVGFCLYAPFAYGLASIGLGALVLTRAGTRPYQSRGTGYIPPAPMPPVPPVPPVNAPPADAGA